MLGVLLALVVLGLVLRAGVRRRRAPEDDLATVLAGAEAAGIISAEQRARILAHAATSGASRLRLDGASWLGIFAGLFVVAGVSLLIARNWEAIGPPARVVAFLVLLGAAGEAAVRWRTGPLALSLPLELLWLFLPLLGIGLYAQTFQLSGDPIPLLLAWLALSAPLAWLSPRPAVAAIHTGAVAGVLFAGNFLAGPAAAPAEAPPAGRLLALTGGADTLGAWALSLGLLGVIGVQSARLLPRAHRHHAVGVGVVWVFALLLADTPLRLQHEGWIALGAVALTTLWLLLLAALDTSLEERGTSLLVWLATLYALTFTWHADDPPDGAAAAAGMAVVLGAVAAVAAVAARLPAARLSPLPAWAGAAKALLAAPVVVAFAYLSTDVRLVWLAAILMNVILLLGAVALMWHGSLVRDARQINTGVVVLLWLLVTRFLDVFGGMLESGVGFIVAGVLLAGLSWALERTRRRLLAAPLEVTP